MVEFIKQRLDKKLYARAHSAWQFKTSHDFDSLHAHHFNVVVHYLIWLSVCLLLLQIAVEGASRDAVLFHYLRRLGVK